MSSICGRHAATRAASSGRAARHGSAAARRPARQWPSTNAWSSSSVTTTSLSVIVFALLSFDAAERRALAVEIGFDLRARARQTRHHGSDRHALHFGYLTIGEAFEHDQQQHTTLILDQAVERAGDVAAAGLRS